MSLVGEAIFLARKYGFLSHSDHKTAAAIVSDFGRGGFGCGGGGVRLQSYFSGDGGGGCWRRRVSGGTRRRWKS